MPDGGEDGLLNESQGEQNPLDSARVAPDNPSAATLRNQMVQLLKQGFAFRTQAVEEAFATVPRENFLPDNLSLEKVYSDEAIVVKFNEEGLGTSSSTQPYLMADMIEAMRLEPGMRVLEIGAGVGYNAAIMAAILGDGSLITSVDLDPEMARIAGENLKRLGPPYSDVTVVAGDGAEGYPANAPYDRVIVTVQQWDISPAWVEQLVTGGVLLLPLTISTHVWGGLIPALRKEADGTLRAIDASSGGFMPMRGTLAHPFARRNHNTYLDQSLVRTCLPPNEILPSYYQVPDATLYLTREGLTAEVEPLLNNPALYQSSRGLLHREVLDPNSEVHREWVRIASLRAPLEWSRISTEQRAAINLAHGFNIMLSVAVEDKLCNLMVGTPTEPKEGREEPQNNHRYEWRGLALALPTAGKEALDLAFIISTEPVLGWRVGVSSQEGNQALEQVAQLWETWQQAGCPQPSSYRPVAFPVSQPAPGPGFIVKRQHYNLLLPT